MLRRVVQSLAGLHAMKARAQKHSLDSKHRVRVGVLGGIAQISTQSKVVQTHSTYCEGLLDFANSLANHDEIARIVPGRVTRSRGQTEHFELMVKTQTDSGWKCVARKGSQLQEVFIVTGESQATLELLIEDTYARVAPKRSRRTRAAQRARGHTLVANA